MERLDSVSSPIGTTVLNVRLNVTISRLAAVHEQGKHVTSKEKHGKQNYSRSLSFADLTYCVEHGFLIQLDCVYRHAVT